MEEAKVTRDDLLTAYSKYVLTKGERPKNVHVFTQEMEVDERHFYDYFADFNALEQAYFTEAVETTIADLPKEEGYAAYDAEKKLLSFYKKLVEKLTAKRSLFLMLFEERNFTSKYTYLQPARPLFTTFITALDFDEISLFANAPEVIQKYYGKSRTEMLWMHFLSVIKFWKEDNSPKFEKTTRYVKDSLDTGFDITDGSLFDKVLNLGKFIWEEKFPLR